MIYSRELPGHTHSRPNLAITVYNYKACCRNPADQASLDKALMGENLDQKFLQNQIMLGLVLHSLSSTGQGK